MQYLCFAQSFNCNSFPSLYFHSYSNPPPRFRPAKFDVYLSCFHESFLTCYRPAQPRIPGSGQVHSVLWGAKITRRVGFSGEHIPPTPNTWLLGFVACLPPPQSPPLPQLPPCCLVRRAFLNPSLWNSEPAPTTHWTGDRVLSVANQTRWF